MRRCVRTGGFAALLAVAGGWAALNRGRERTPVDVATVGHQNLQAKVTPGGQGAG